MPASGLLVWKTLLSVALVKRENTGVQQELEEVATPLTFFFGMVKINQVQSMEIKDNNKV